MASLSDNINSSIDLIKKAKELQDLSKDQLIISLCSGTGCKAAGSDYLYDILKEEVKKNQPNIKKEIIIRRTGCHGFCEKGPLIIFYPQEICYLGATEEDIPLLVSETLKGNLIEKLLYKTDESKLVLKEFDIPFYKYQKRIILANNSKIDSKSIEDYILLGGYRALSKALTEMNPEDVLNEVKESGLRGRGGGGFPTGLKWEITRKAKGNPKYMIVNGDEGDPGAYMDRSILEGNPHSVLEGLIIGAYVIGG
ncbi:MAG: NADH-quinone oxidoreductase subunit F, partial [Actinobacteria bacterium]|nr:NADH-quinone oxidoreductase subunit F [Actinomycetota bacterium]